jgi:hypothetical protein
MPRAQPHPEERLLTSAQCAERLCIHEKSWWEVLKRPDAEVLRRGRRCVTRGRVRWKASALSAFIDALPRNPEWRPPAAGGRRAKSTEEVGAA